MKKIGRNLLERVARTQTKKGWDYPCFGANQDFFHQSSKIGTGGVAVSGHLPAGASYTNNYIASQAGMRQAIGSGMVGMFDIASGSMCSGSPVKADVPVLAAIPQGK